jgi:hypothetical protein
MARTPNYNFEKRQKDLARPKKKEEKLQKKSLKKESADGEPEGEATENGSLPTDSAGPATD